MTTADRYTHLVLPYEGAGDAFEGIWKRWHTWEWSPENTCRVDSLWYALQGFTGRGDDHLGWQCVTMFPGLKKALATPDTECAYAGSYDMLEDPGYGCHEVYVAYDSWPDDRYQAAQKLIREFEGKLLAWCKSIDGGK